MYEKTRTNKLMSPLGSANLHCKSQISKIALAIQSMQHQACLSHKIIAAASDHDEFRKRYLFLFFLFLQIKFKTQRVMDDPSKVDFKEFPVWFGEFVSFSVQRLLHSCSTELGSSAPLDFVRSPMPKRFSFCRICTVTKLGKGLSKSFSECSSTPIYN